MPTDPTPTPRKPGQRRKGVRAGIWLMILAAIFVGYVAWATYAAFNISIPHRPGPIERLLDGR